MSTQTLHDAIQHEQIRTRLEKSSRHIVVQIEKLQELRNKYKVKNKIGTTRGNI